MRSLYIDQLELPRRRWRWQGSTLWRELCFWRVVARRFGVRALLMLAVLLGGTLAFVLLEPQREHSFIRALYYTWSLVFGKGLRRLTEHQSIPRVFPHSLVPS